MQPISRFFLPKQKKKEKDNQSDAESNDKDPHAPSKKSSQVSSPFFKTKKKRKSSGPSTKTQHSTSNLPEMLVNSVSDTQRQSSPKRQRINQIEPNLKRHMAFQRQLLALEPASDGEAENSFLNSGTESDQRNLKGAGPKNYTPLEQQVVELKSKHSGMLLAVECGYRYRFFGEDAVTAANVLSIGCHMDHNFMVASVPVYRLPLHVQRLCAAGYKVGVVSQTETAAMKAAGLTGTTKSSCFTRSLSAVYTQGTLLSDTKDQNWTKQSGSDGAIEEEDGFNGETLTHEGAKWILSIAEHQKCDGKNVSIGMVAVEISSSQVLMDCIEDVMDGQRNELETAVWHLQPVEILAPKRLSSATEQCFAKYVKDTSETNKTTFTVRMERYSNSLLNLQEAERLVVSFTTSWLEEEGSNSSESSSNSLNLLDLAPTCVCSVAALLRYLKEFGLDNTIRGCSFKSLKSSSSICLESISLKDLEIIRNQNYGTSYGTLAWILTHTKTSFGNHTLRNWILNPSTNLDVITHRQEAVEEVAFNCPQCIEEIVKALSGRSKVNSALVALRNKKINPSKFWYLMSAMEEFGKIIQVDAKQRNGIKSTLLRTEIESLPCYLPRLTEFTRRLNPVETQKGNLKHVFQDTTDFPDLEKAKGAIDEIEGKLKEELKYIQRRLKNKSLQFKTLKTGAKSSIEHLIELKKTDAQNLNIPEDWLLASETKGLVRYHTPEVLELQDTLLLCREQEVIAAQAAWVSYTNQVDLALHSSFRTTIRFLGTLDAIHSLSIVAKREGYCKPKLREDMCLKIQAGRHPILDQVLEGGYVPNDISFDAKHRMLVVTGPNMGGKSSFVRSVALLAIMTQIGSFIPAEKAEMPVFDGIYTRMGAGDDISAGMSTFQLELQITSNILKKATGRSLIILDELGRGTSTYDGVAIARATAKYIANHLGCVALFVTHFPQLVELHNSEEAQKRISVGHMSFLESKESGPEDSKIIFLYKMVHGKAAHSYGLNVAKMAGLDEEILSLAELKSQELKAIQEKC